MNHHSSIAGLFIGTMLLLGSSSVQADTLRCESQGGSYKVCAVDTRGGVRLTNQLSSQGCWQNDTWGYDRNRIWVDRGCRAEFWVGEKSSSSNNKVAGVVALGVVAAAIIASKNNRDHYDNNNYNNYNQRDDRYRNDRYDNYGNPNRTLRCESKDNRFVYCSMPIRGHVEVYKQLSSSNCNYGSSWGVDRNRVWVSNGCRAEFAIY